jgi:hypothetical protein
MSFQNVKRVPFLTIIPQRAPRFNCGFIECIPFAWIPVLLSLVIGGMIAASSSGGKERHMQRTIEYFDESGRGDTERTLELASQYARQAGIKTIVLASTRGYTAGKALEICSGLNLVAVGIGRDRFPAEEIERFERVGSVIFSREIESDYPSDMQTAFRRFGQGTKVAVQVVVLATQAGLVDEGETVIGIGGSSQGSDTALVIRASWGYPDVHVAEILCKPI